MIEECLELAHVVHKHMRGRASLAELASEVSDVEIMIAQLKMMVDDPDLFKLSKEGKLNRLEYRLSMPDVPTGDE